MKAVLIGSARDIAAVYPPQIVTQLAGLVELYEQPVEKKDLDACRGVLSQAEAAFSTWGMLPLSEAEIAQYLPRLRRVFYAAGSVQYFARPFLRSGVGVSSAWAANAIPVIEYTVSLILLGLKGFFPAMSLVKGGRWNDGHALSDRHANIYGARVGVLGAGMIGSGVLRELARHDVERWVYDPYLSPERARELGARKVDSLDELFASCHVVSNHIANLPATRGMLTYEHFSRLMPNSCFINSGRNSQIEESGFIRAFREDPSRTAILDVIDPNEPPTLQHPYYTLPNVYMTPHIAGTLGNEKARMSQYMVDEFKRFLAGAPLKWDVTEKMLETMA